MTIEKKQLPDPLIRNAMFPEPAAIFSFAPVSLNEALGSGIVALDTNVLLTPFTTGKASLEQIRNTYTNLANQGRLRIPGQVAREFAEQRAEKLKLLFQQLSRKRQVSIDVSEYPLLEAIGTYPDLRTCEGQLSSKLSEYRRLIASLLEDVKSWQWNDPVSNLYRDVFIGDVVVDPPYDNEQLLAELHHRHSNHVPPGYKDHSNEHSGVGDLLIWKTLLYIGKESTNHLIFVSGDEKSDWRYQSESQPLYARFELLDEYRRHSGGKSLFIISFANLLEHFGVPAPVVAEVKQEASTSQVRDSIASGTPSRGRLAKTAVVRWLGLKFPDRNIYEGAWSQPDIVVDNLRGYEFRYVKNSSTIGRRIREILNDLPSLLKYKLPTSLIIAVDDLNTAHTMAEVLLRAVRAGVRSTGKEASTEVILGFADEDNAFVPFLSELV